MGRWAQRRLGNGGGGSGAAAPILITSIEIEDPSGSVFVNFNAPIDAADFIAANFELTPGNINAVGLVQNDATSLGVDFGAPVAIGNSVEYSGTAPNVSTPQTVLIT